MKNFFQEFKEFINRGNVVDLAVAVAVGAAFTAIVNSVVKDLVMPVVSAFIGGINFADLKLTIPLGAGESAIMYGNFINAVIQFLIIALVIFCIVKALNKMKTLTKREECEELKHEAHCIFCKEEVKEGATRCPHCAAELPEPAQAVPLEAS